MAPSVLPPTFSLRRVLGIFGYPLVLWAVMNGLCDSLGRRVLLPAVLHLVCGSRTRGQLNEPFYPC